MKPYHYGFWRDRDKVIIDRATTYVRNNLELLCFERIAVEDIGADQALRNTWNGQNKLVHLLNILMSLENEGYEEIGKLAERIIERESLLHFATLAKINHDTSVYYRR